MNAAKENIEEEKLALRKILSGSLIVKITAGSLVGYRLAGLPVHRGKIYICIIEEGRSQKEARSRLGRTGELIVCCWLVARSGTLPLAPRPSAR